MKLRAPLSFLAAVGGLLLVGIFGPVALFAQTDTGRILGSVVDQSAAL